LTKGANIHDHRRCDPLEGKMVEEAQFDSMTLDQVRKVAVERGILGASKLTKKALLRHLRRLQELESTSQIDLQTSLEMYQIEGIMHMLPHHLALIALQADRLMQNSVADLRDLARKEGIEDVGRLRKKEIVAQILASYADSIRSEASRAERQIPIQAPLRSHVRLRLRRWLGRAIQVASAAGIALSIVCLILVPILAYRVSDSIDGLLLTISEETSMAAVSLRQVRLSISEGVQTLEAAEASIRNMERSMKDTKPLIGSTVELLVEHAPKIIDDTRHALGSAEESARAVDQVLRNLARLGPITGVSYDPEQPLDEGIADVTGSLEPLPATLREVGDELNQAGSSLEEVSGSLGVVGDEMKDFAEEISSKNFMIANLADDLDTLSEAVDHARDRIKPMVLVGAVCIGLFLIGVALGQTAMYDVGRNMYRMEREIIRE
jgi:hypothetical protein